jgi:DNA-binding MarR family transcriptional regulator
MIIVDSEFLGSLVGRVSGELRTASAAALASADVSPRTFGLLAWLEGEGPATQVAMSRRSGVDRTSMVGLVDRLESQGLVERRRDESDRRVNLVAVTVAGRSLVIRHQQQLREIERRVVEPLDEQERAMLMAMLRRIVAGFDDRDDETQ